MQELFAKEIPVAFAIDWKQSSDGNLSDAIQEKVESSGRNLPRLFSCTSVASFWLVPARSLGRLLGIWTLAMILHECLLEQADSWRGSPLRSQVCGFAPFRHFRRACLFSVLSSLSVKRMTCLKRRAVPLLQRCFERRNKRACSIYCYSTRWVLDGAIFPWSTDHVYLFIGFVFIMRSIAWNFGRWRLETVQHTWRRSWRSFHCQSKCSGWSLIDFDRTFSRFGTALGRLGYT